MMILHEKIFYKGKCFGDRAEGYVLLSGLPAGGLMEELLPVGTDGGVESTALDRSWLQGRCRWRETVTVLGVYLTVGHPCAQREL